MSFAPKTALRVVSVLTGGVVLASATYAYQVSKRMNASRGLGITDISVAQDSFLESSTLRDYVNPQNRLSGKSDTHTVVLDVPLNSGISDENILARATKAFFNGWVFYPESKVLRVLNLADKRYAKLSSTTIPIHIWDARELSESSLPELHTVLFSQFRVADIHLVDAPRPDDVVTGTSESYVDIMFGSDLERFSGFHRLSVQHNETDDAGKLQKVQLRLQCYACNPQSDEPVGNPVIMAFHSWYAKSLFRDTVGQVNAWLLHTRQESKPE